MTGPEALAAFDQAAAFVKAGEYEAARKVELLPSDRKVIEDKIMAAGANTAKVQQGE